MKSGGPSVLLVDDEPRLRAQLRAVLDDHEVVVRVKPLLAARVWSWPAGCSPRWS